MKKLVIGLLVILSTISFSMTEEEMLTKVTNSTKNLITEVYSLKGIDPILYKEVHGEFEQFVGMELKYAYENMDLILNRIRANSKAKLRSGHEKEILNKIIIINQSVEFVRQHKRNLL